MYIMDYGLIGLIKKKAPTKHLGFLFLKIIRNIIMMMMMIVIVIMIGIRIGIMYYLMSCLNGLSCFWKRWSTKSLSLHYTKIALLPCSVDLDEMDCHSELTPRLKPDPRPCPRDSLGTHTQMTILSQVGQVGLKKSTHETSRFFVPKNYLKSQCVFEGFCHHPKISKISQVFGEQNVT